MTKSIITITDNGDGDVSLQLEFVPAAKTKGPMTADQVIAMRAIRAIKAASDQEQKETT